jgi:hypothetical protein
MTKLFSSVIIVEFAYNNRVAASKEEYIELLKEEYLARHDIELEGHEITEITEKPWITKEEVEASLKTPMHYEKEIEHE